MKGVSKFVSLFFILSLLVIAPAISVKEKELV